MDAVTTRRRRYYENSPPSKSASMLTVETLNLRDFETSVAQSVVVSSTTADTIKITCRNTPTYFSYSVNMPAFLCLHRRYTVCVVY